jgi:hypothetical protein
MSGRLAVRYMRLPIILLYMDGSMDFPARSLLILTLVLMCLSKLLVSVSILASFCVWTKSLMYKAAVNRDSTCQSIFRRLCTAKKIEDFRFPVSRPDDLLSRPNAHLSIAPFVRTTCHTVRTPDRPASSVWTTYLSVRNLHYIKKLMFQLASVRTSQQPVRTSISDRLASYSFQVQNNGRSIHPSGRCWCPVQTRVSIRQES